MGLFSRLVKVSKAAIQSKTRDILDKNDPDDSVDDIEEEMAKSRARAQERARSTPSPHTQEEYLESPSKVVGRDVQVSRRDGNKRSL